MGALGCGSADLEVQRTTWGSAQAQERLSTPVLKEPRKSAEALTQRRKSTTGLPCAGRRVLCREGSGDKVNQHQNFDLFSRNQKALFRQPLTYLSLPVFLVLWAIHRWAGKCLTNTSPREEASSAVLANSRGVNTPTVADSKLPA